MRKPEKSKKKKMAALKRGAKRNARLVSTKKTRSKRRELFLKSKKLSIKKQMDKEYEIRQKLSLDKKAEFSNS